MKKPTNHRDANALVDIKSAELAKKRRAHTLAERNYLIAREWLQELEGKCRG
jgi:hypothetical protein